MGSFRSVKEYKGFSTCFRQYGAEGTHCKFLHGYGVSFTLFFKGDLDARNWVFDFGGMKRAKHSIDGLNPDKWFKYMFDHTTVISVKDPHLHTFQRLHNEGVIQLRVLKDTGAEKFAQYIYTKVSQFLEQETQGRVSLEKVEFRENEKNAAVYSA